MDLSWSGPKRKRSQLLEPHCLRGVSQSFGPNRKLTTSIPNETENELYHQLTDQDIHDDGFTSSDEEDDGKVDLEAIKERTDAEPEQAEVEGDEEYEDNDNDIDNGSDDEDEDDEYVEEEFSIPEEDLILTARQRSTKYKRNKMDYSASEVIDLNVRNQGRPFSPDMDIKIVLAESKEDVLAITNKGSKNKEIKTGLANFADLVKHSRKYYGTNILPPEIPLTEVGRPFRVVDEDAHNGKMYDFKSVGRAMTELFGIEHYTYILVVRASSNNGKYPRDLIRGLRVLRIDKVPRPVLEENHDAVFLKSQVCFPRYKSRMTIYVVPGDSDKVERFYTSQLLLEQDRITGEIKDGMIAHGPEAIGYPMVPVGTHPETIKRYAGYCGLPVSAFIDKSGKIQSQRFTSSRSEQQVVGNIRSRTRAQQNIMKKSSSPPAAKKKKTSSVSDDYDDDYDQAAANVGDKRRLRSDSTSSLDSHRYSITTILGDTTMVTVIEEDSDSDKGREFKYFQSCSNGLSMSLWIQSSKEFQWANYYRDHLPELVVRGCFLMLLYVCNFFPGF